MTKFLWGVLVLSIIVVLIWVCQSSMEPFEDMKMRPWFGYEPGYGPGWGRKGCCKTDLASDVKV
jgi:hypothetical protein